MTDPIDFSPDSTNTAGSVELGAGGLLRQAREASGIHVGALSVMLKVPVQRLEALESERWDLLPDAVFVRALAASVCRALKVDPAPVLMKLPNPNPQSIEVGASLSTPFRGDTSSGATTHISSQFSRPLILAVLALLLGALAMALFPSIQQLWVRSQVGAERVVAVPVPTSQVGTEVSSAGIGSGAPLSPQATSAPSAPGAMTPGAIGPVEGSAVPALAASAPAEPERTGDPSSQVTSDSIIVFKVKGPSWIQVTDAGGVVVLKKELGAGEAAGVSGVPPLSVVVGRADVTTVEVRGKPFDLAALAKNNVARFEVKE